MNVMGCEFLGCEKPAKTRGLCSGHAEQRRLGKSLAPLRGTVPKPFTPCALHGCGRQIEGNGPWCKAHAKQKRQGKEPQPLAPPRYTHNVDIRQFVDEALAGRDRSTCWPWPFAKSTQTKRRAYMRHDGVAIPVARYVLWQQNGTWPVYACHHCDNDNCWNPAHLYDGDAATNAADMAARGRWRNQVAQGYGW